MALTPWEEHLAQARQTALDVLRLRWDDFYAITWDGSRCRAERCDGGGVVTADTPEGLNEAMIDNFLRAPVPPPRT